MRSDFVLFYVYGDGDDDPYIIHSPPASLDALLDEWRKLDAAYVETGDDENWKPVNEWLADRGVEIFEAPVMSL
jgi:hypothetical protein